MKNTIGQIEKLSKKKKKKLPYTNITEKDGKAYYEYEDKLGLTHNVSLGNIVKCRVIKNVDDNTVNVMLNNGNSTYEMTPSRIEPEKILELADYGFDVTFKNKYGFYCYIADLYSVAPTKTAHSSLGWAGDKNSFHSDNIIFFNKSAESYYKGEFEITQKGELNDWIQGINTLVVGHLGLELVLLTAVCAVVNGYIGEDIGQQTFLVHLCGRSSTGKTTAEKLAVSLCTSPKFGSDSLLNTFSGTFNSLIGLLGCNYGMLLVLDDTSAITIKDTIKFIYAATSNVDKRRLNSASEQIKPDTWQTVVLTSGETPFVCDRSNKDGYKVRYIEIDIPFTESAQHARDIDKFVANNYGTALLPLVQGIMKIGKKRIIVNYEKYHNKFLTSLDKGKYNDRLSKIYALYMVSAALLKKIFGILIDKNAIFNYFCTYHTENKNVGDVNERAYEYIKQSIDEHLGNFIVNTLHNNTNKNNFYPKDCWGTIFRDGNCTEVCISRSKCDELLVAGGFGNVKEVYQHFRDMRYIECDKELFTKRRVILSAQQKCIVFNFNNEDLTTKRKSNILKFKKGTKNNEEYK